MMDDFDEVRSAVLHLESEFGSYAALGRVYDASFTSFWWVGERECDLPIIRRVLGFRPKKREVEPCSDCGDPHLVPWCTKKYGQPRKPSKNGHRKRPKRIQYKFDLPTEEHRQALDRWLAHMETTRREYWTWKAEELMAEEELVERLKDEEITQAT